MKAVSPATAPRRSATSSIFWFRRVVAPLREKTNCGFLIAAE